MFTLLNAIRDSEKLTMFSIGILNIHTLLNLLSCSFVAHYELSKRKRLQGVCPLVTVGPTFRSLYYNFTAFCYTTAYLAP